MELTFAGSGSAFTVGDNNYHSNLILTSNKTSYLLIDCGSDIRFSLYELGLTYRNIDHVYISHLHADHIGGLEWLALTRLFDAETEKPHLYIHEMFIKKLWINCLCGGLGHLSEESASNFSDFFYGHSLLDNQKFEWEGISFSLIKMLHIGQVMPSFGLFFNVNSTNILVTTDAQFMPDYLYPFYRQADIIFQDCETSEKKTGVHAHYSELKKLSPYIKQKMWLYHYNPGKKPDAKLEGFLGFVQRGQTFYF